MSELKEVCAYVRVSTDKQEELSPDSQIRLIKEYAQQHGMLLTHIYMEEHGISGKKADKRPAFQEMIATCKEKSHPYDAILLWKFSRFARNIDESTYYKSILRKKCNVDVISISEPIVEGMYGRLIEMVIEWSDEFYLYNLSGEVMRGMTQKALQGGYNSNCPIGYTKEKGTDKIPQIDPSDALIVKKIFNMYTEEKRALADIALLLNKEGYTTKRGGEFETRTIGYILENPFYIGKIRWNYYNRHENKRKNAEDVIISDGKHEAIISREQFEEAGKRLASERIRVGYGKKKRTTAAGKHWLCGMLKCSECGGTLGYNAGNKDYKPYFQCWKRGKGLCTVKNSNSIREDEAEKRVIGCLEELINMGVNFNYKFSTISSNNVDNELILKELHSLDTKERRIKDAYISGVDTLEEYKDNKSILQKKRKELEKKLSDQEQPEPEHQDLSVDLQGTVNLLKDKDADYIAKGNALRMIVDYFVWNKEKDEMQAVLNQNIISTGPVSDSDTIKNIS